MEVAGSEISSGSEPSSTRVRLMLAEFPPRVESSSAAPPSLGRCSPSSWTRLRTVRSLQLPQALPLFAICVYLLGLHGLHNILQRHKRPQRTSHALPGEVRVQKGPLTLRRRQPGDTAWLSSARAPICDPLHPLICCLVNQASVP